MGQAFDRDGEVLGEVSGNTKREVFEQLEAQFKDAAEIRIRSVPPARPGAAYAPLDAAMSNDLAYQLGEIARVVGGLRTPDVSDSIDRGLILRRELAAAGFDLVRRA